MSNQKHAIEQEEGLYTKLQKIDSAQKAQLKEMESLISSITMILCSSGFEYNKSEGSGPKQGYDLLVNDLGQNCVTMLGANRALEAIKNYLTD